MREYYAFGKHVDRVTERYIRRFYPRASRWIARRQTRKALKRHYRHLTSNIYFWLRWRAPKTTENSHGIQFVGAEPFLGRIEGEAQRANRKWAEKHLKRVMARRACIWDMPFFGASF